MMISELIEKLKEVKSVHGNLEVTMTGTYESEDGDHVFESTIESHLIMEDEFAGKKEKRLKLFWQM